MVRVDHPFHPLCGRELPCVGRRYNRYGCRLLLQDEEGAVWSVPPRWTDSFPPSAALILGAGRALLRVEDALALAELVAPISSTAGAVTRK